MITFNPIDFMKQILRIITGLIFILSGFVKAVDVVGFSFKLEEYFSPTVFNLPFFEKLSLPLSIFVVALELILGLMLLLKIQVRKVLPALVALCIFFAFLTFYSAYFNKVTDCGCFGDAIKFTPWQSFFKDIFLLVLLLILWLLYRKDRKADETVSWAVPAFLVISAAFAFVIVYGIVREPVIDFRDYKIGTDLNAELKKVRDTPPTYKMFYTLKNTKTNEEKEVSQDEYVDNKEYWQDGTPWSIEEDKSESRIVSEGYKSEISKFHITDVSGNDMTNEITYAPKAVIVFSYAPEKVDKNLLHNIEMKLISLDGTYIAGVSTQPETYRYITNGVMDGTAIKTIARSNPFILVLERGKIMDKIPAEVFLKKY